MKPSRDIVGWRAKIPTGELTESFVIFLYGVTNVFLEHLSAWGGAWAARDLEHVAISIMFFGGGLVSFDHRFHVFDILRSWKLICGDSAVCLQNQSAYGTGLIPPFSLHLPTWINI